MRVSVSWLREYVDAPTDPAVLEPALVRVGLEVEEIDDLRASVSGPLVIGRVAEIEELTGLKKPIRYCQVAVGESEPRGIICGATNFAVGDLVPVALPGAVLPGGFAITARKTYGRVSDGMICSAKELGIGEDHAGIMVLPGGAGIPGADARPAVGLDDVVVELDSKPLRGHCFSVRGVARELSHSLGLPYRDPADIDPAPPGATAEPAHPVTVMDPTGCDRFATRLVRGIDPAAPSPEWLRQRLVHAGVRPISLAVDITNYLMLELGQPMHAFDADRLHGPLVVRRARSGERLVTLDGVDRALDPTDMIICDDTGPISLAAVMGGQTSEIVPETVNVLFEAAHWEPTMVGRTARRHKLPSEAAKRWERGVDPQVSLVALQRAVELLVTHAGGEVDDRVGDIDTVAEPAAIVIPADLPSRIAGVTYPPERVVELLAEIGCAVEQTGDRLQVTPPSWRADLTDPADLVEEVARLDGYDRIPSVLPQTPPGAGLTPAQRRRRTVGRALAEAGYVEALCYPFVGEAAWEAFGLGDDDPRRETVRIANPISGQEPSLRSTLLPPLLAALRRNLGRGAREVALYEIGSVFRSSGRSGVPPRLPVTHRPEDAQLAAAQQHVPSQEWHAAAVIAGDASPAGWWGAGRPADWADAVQAARTVLAAAGLPEAQFEVRAAEYAPWHPGRCAEFRVADQVVGHAGELHPAVCEAMELPKRTCAMELDLDAVPLPGVAPAPRFASYPPALIDVALVVANEVPAADVHQALLAGAGELLESVRLFDVYTGEQVGAGRKSLAYKLVFRSVDRTLTVEEAVAARDAAVAVAAERVGAELRGA
ncbi:phenylalanine--tRNA ligase subunit beta [Natronosporangium hydrolyticum]|uniref:Phenylalanine--tRNA ligase beta subunit n=1 Tax=Natronosporangium hydrolyticum TaxID=2811111 RepID=A0A895YM01_9ACTN|nr:phenylalanine--tRNA ligase subunit beta [Natronosporangium hydrolyticum]QSB16995.1 phenylalanine--tRNA ligase subunit beta [Natronosporangium hydrolyticum]